MQNRTVKRLGQQSLQVLLSGTDSQGHVFGELAIATEITVTGALLIIGRPVDCTMIRVWYRGNTARFHVVWKGCPGSDTYKIAVNKDDGDSCPWGELLSTSDWSAELGLARADSVPANCQSARGDSGSGSATEHSYRQSRRWRRHKLDVPIRVIVHGPDKTSLIDGRGNELSEGGMALTAGVELLQGDTVQVEFTPPYSGLPIRQTGIVRNRTGYRYGIEFVVTNTRDAEQVERLLAMLRNV